MLRLFLFFYRNFVLSKRSLVHYMFCNYKPVIIIN